LSDNDLNTVWLKGLRKAAEGGDPKAVKRLIEVCRDTITEFTYPKEKFNIEPQAGVSGRISNIHPEVAEYLHRCFDLYLQVVEIGKALGINTGIPRAREIENITERNINICADLHRLKDKEGFSKAGARYREVAPNYRLRPETVRKDIWGNRALRDAGMDLYRLERKLAIEENIAEEAKQEIIARKIKELTEKEIELVEEGFNAEINPPKT
jgi:hypothetical protein